jgi:sugar O-acyltransferase (sialic acid O-acetyltransferase NeuD family)
MIKIVLFGVFNEIIELCERKKYKIVYGIDPKINNESLPFFVFKSEKDFFESQKVKDEIEKYRYVIVPDLPSDRKRIYDKNLLQNRKLKYISIIDNGTFISPSSNIGEGTVVMYGSLISSNSSIGNFVKMNFFARVHHDVVIEDFCTIAPGATILGRCKIRRNSYIGANSTILPGVIIGENAIVGAGAVVTKNVSPNSIVAGVPAKELKKKHE